MIKTSIRFYDNKPVRARWDETANNWCYAATDLIIILINSSAPRIYWNALKRRNHILHPYIKQFKLMASDGRYYLTDTITEAGFKLLTQIIPSKNSEYIQKFLKGQTDPIDAQSKLKAYTLFKNKMIDNSDVGKTKALQQIHAFLFEGLYSFAGQVRTKNIAKGNFIFANANYLDVTLKTIDQMPENSLKDIIKKYVEMNVAHPFLEGNGRATRIWLDLILIKQMQKCVDWSKIAKEDYLKAMEISPSDDAYIYQLIYKSLTDDIDNREIFLSGIDSSYYYEET